MANSRSKVAAKSPLGGLHRHGDTPTTPTSPTIEQLLRGTDGSRWSLRSIQTSGKEHVMEEDHNPTPRKFLAKVKEKAKKWRQSLSKKKHNDDGNATLRRGTSLDNKDDENEDEDPEYLGAPMYESEKAPEGYRETARQHPRTIPVIAEKHILTSSVNTAKSVRTTPSLRYANKTTTTTTTTMMPVTPKVPPKTISEAMPEKLEQQGLVVSVPRPLKSPPGRTSLTSKSPVKSSLSTYPLAKTASAPAGAAKSSDSPTPSPRSRSLTPQAPAPLATKQQEVTQTALEKPAPASAPAAVATNSDHAYTTEPIWDKGVSVKEYIKHKLEPGEDEKALSRVISQAISPRKSPGDTSVVDKFKEAVSSLLWNNASSQAQKQHLVFHSAQSSLSNLPVSTDAHEAVEEESHGRILQTN